jgi:hypothetical protein
MKKLKKINRKHVFRLSILLLIIAFVILLNYLLFKFLAFLLTGYGASLVSTTLLFFIFIIFYLFLQFILFPLHKRFSLFPELEFILNRYTCWAFMGYYIMDAKSLFSQDQIGYGEEELKIIIASMLSFDS